MARIFLLTLWSLAAVYAGSVRAENNENGVLTITYANSDVIREGEWMVEFFAPWCSACQQFASTWESFGKWSKDKAVKVGQVDVTKEPLLSGNFLVQRLPSVFHIINGEVRIYEGERTLSHLTTFVEREKWRNWEPMPWWKSPTSRHMKILGYLYWIAGLGQNIQAYLETEFKMPPYGVFIAIACFTIIVGLLLGGIIVCSFELCARWMSKSPAPLEERKKRVRTVENTPTDKPETTATEEVHSDRSTSGEEQSQAESKEEEVESEEGEKEVAAVQERKEEVKKEEEVKKKEGSVTGKQGKKAAGKSTPSPKEGAKKRHGNKAEQKSGVQEDESNAGETEPAEEPGWSTVTGRKPKGK